MEQIPKDQEETAESSKDDSKKVENKTDNSSSTDDELDIKSAGFNPLKALYEPDYRVTVQQPKFIYQNMAAFETALNKVGFSGLSDTKNTQASGSKDAKDIDALLVEEEQNLRRFQEHQMAIKTQAKVKNKHLRNLMMQMAQSDGPLKKLQEYVTEGRTVRVVIRREHGIKGYIEGVLKMFDRHWNLLLVDAVESLKHRKYKYVEDKLVIHQEAQDCSELLQKLGITLPKQDVKNLGRKKIEIKRHLPQILLRGEHVVLISAKSLG